jgi:DNA polymerase (family 10)
MATNMDNTAVAATFQRLADLLEIRGESAYRVGAYRRAAESLSQLSEPVHAIWARGELKTIPGVGEAIAEKVASLLETGSFPLLQEVESEIPAGVTALLAVPDIGPKRARLLYDSLGIDSLDALRAAAESGQLAEVKGIGAGAAKRIAAGLKSLQASDTRLPLGIAREHGLALIQRLRVAVPDIRKIELSGSIRRVRETIGDLDIVAAANVAGPVIDAFERLPDIAYVERRGPNRSQVVLHNGLSADLWVLPEENWGSLLFHVTGSKAHDVAMRDLAHQYGAKLSEYGISTAESRVLCPEEADIYAFFGMQYIPPTMREDMGEIALARQGALPDIVQQGDLRGDLHLHSRWSDGKRTIREMAEAALARGYAYLCITDHSGGLAVANGLNADRLRAQRREIDQVNAELAPFRVLHGVEVEVRGDGRLDLPDDVLAELDWVNASVHNGLRQERERLTERALAAIRHPLVDVLSHPTGRIVGGRAGGDFDLEAIFTEAARTGTALEINADPARLDLRDVHARAAVAAGCDITIGSDAHDIPGLDNAFYGIGVAQRAWIAAARVLNTLPLDDLLARRKRNSHDRR